MPLSRAEESAWETLPPVDELRDMILQLNPLHREILFLRYHHGYSEKEIAAQLGLNYAYVRKLFERARTALLELMEEGEQAI